MVDVAAFRVRDDTVWKQIKYLLLGSATLFLINIFYGFDNALTDGAIPRWQTLIHLHAGSIGWITLSIIAMAVWIFSGDRELSDSYIGRIKNLTRFSIIVFACYVVSFGLAFSKGDNFFFLLPIFGTLSAVAIWVSGAFAVTQYRKSEVKTSPQLMVTGALVITSLGALMGVLLGLENALNATIIPGADRVGAHAGVMDGYLLLAASAVVGWFLGRNAEGRYSRGALAQALCFFLAPVVVWLGLIVDQEMLAGLSAPLIIIGVVIFAVRNARDVFKLNPLRRGPGGWVFFGSIWTVIWAILFAYIIVLFVSGDLDPETVSPELAVLFVLFAHSAFVGTMTNLILGADSVRSHASRHILSWAEPVGLWLMNLGIIVFIGLEYINDSRLGAIVMGIGVLVGVGTMMVRLLSSEGETATAAAAAE
jgi:hypothetical protein